MPGPHDGSEQKPAASGGLDQPAPRFDDEFVLEIDEEFLSSTMDDEDLEFVLEDPGQLLGSLAGDVGAATPVSPLEEVPIAESLADGPMALEAVAPFDGAFEPSAEEPVAGAASMDAGSEDDGLAAFAGEDLSLYGSSDDLEAAAPGPMEAGDLDASWFNESAAELASVPTEDDGPVAEEWAEDDLGFTETTWDEGESNITIGEDADVSDDELAALLGAGDAWSEGDGEETAGAPPTRSMTRLLVAAVLLLGGGYFGLQYLAPSMLKFGGAPSTEVASVPTPRQPAPVAVDPAPVTPDPEPAIEPEPELVVDPVAPEPAIVPEPVVVTDDVPVVEPAPVQPEPALVTLPIAEIVTPEPAPVRIPSAEEILRVRTTSDQIVELRKGETIVELKNGHYFKGRMKRIKNDRLTLADGTSEYTFHLSEIRILEAHAPEYVKFGDLPAAAVTLVNGQRLRGRLVKQTEEHVVLAYEAGRVEVPQGEVAKVSFSGRVHF